MTSSRENRGNLNRRQIMALGDGIRRNIAAVDPSERALLRDAFLELNRRFFPGTRTDSPAGGVTWWFKQDEIHQATHVHHGPQFLPWHREIVNRLEEMLRQINPQLSLHYWDWTQDPRSIPNANLGGGTTGTLNLFTPDFMGYGGVADQAIGPPWQNAVAPWRSDGYYVPNASPHRDSSGNPADPPAAVSRHVNGSPASAAADSGVLNAADFPTMRVLMETIHDAMHGFVSMGGPHISFRDPFVFLLHSNVDRLFAMWQTAIGHPERLDPNTVYGAEGVSPSILDNNIEPWAGTPPTTRPWAPPENEQVVKNYKHPSVVHPPCYDTLPTYPALVTLETPSINFNDVPAAETAARAIVFSAVSCHDVHLSISAGPTVTTGPGSFGTFPAPIGTSVTIPHISSSTPPKGRLWISYKGTNPLDAATGTVTVHCAETNQDFVVNIAANTIQRPTVAVMLVLDQSGSMDWLAGIDPTTKRIDVLHQAATQFVQLAQDSSRQGDGVGMVSFDHNAYPGVSVTTNMGTGLDLAPVITAIQNLHPAGATSIGNGVALGRNTLNPVTGFTQKAMVVFTDGLENTPLYIADVMDSINDRTFAIGLGTAQQVSAAALTALANNTGGRLLLSGQLSPSIDDYFRLSKFFMQVLAGVTNTNIVTDPSGYIAPGMKVRIPFVLNDTDIDSTVILLTDLPAVRFVIETPAGDIMDPTRAGTLGATYAVGTNMSYYRFTLPLPLGGKPAQEGTWYALLQVDDIIFRRLAHGSDLSFAAGAARMVHGVRYNLSVQAYSNLRMQANLSQDSLQPGATLTLHAALSEYGIPVDHRAIVRAEVERPDNSVTTLALAEVEPGRFETSTVASIQGVYRFRLLASGITMRKAAFTREQLLSGVVVLGGDNPAPKSDPSTRAHDKQLCDLLECLLSSETLGRFLTENHVDPNALHRCIQQWCKQRLGPPSAQEASEREGSTAQPAQSARLAAATGPSSDMLAQLSDIIRRAQH
jgi:hypothetical protein